MRGLMCCFFAAAAIAGAAPPAPTTNPNPDEIIQKFAAKEAEFRKAREAYTYRQTVKIEELDPEGNVQGKYEIVSDIIFGADNKRTEKVVRAPVNTLKNLILTPEDEQDLRNVQPFVLTSEDIGKYDVRFLGKQNADEIPCYVFAVKPKTMVKGERYFEGQIWVDDRDLQIVKTYGKGVGELKSGSAKNQAFPKFETYREQIDGKYWFPTYSKADATLHFKGDSYSLAQDVHVRQIVRYTNYKQFGTSVRVLYDGEEISKAPAAPQTPPPNPPKN